MNVQLRPDFQKFVEDRVRAGEYASSQDVVEAGIARLMRDTAPEMDEARAARLRKGSTAVYREKAQPWEDLLGKYF